MWPAILACWWSIAVLALPSYAQSDAAPQRWAVVIGVASHSDPAVRGVSQANADAKAMRDWLTTVGGVPGENLALLLHDGRDDVSVVDASLPIAATRSNWIAVTEAWLPQRVGPQDLVFFYFSGQAAAQEGTGYLLPQDARRDFLVDTALSADRVFRVLAETEATTVVWLDTSFAGRGAEWPARFRGPVELAARLPAARNVTWIAAAAGKPLKPARDQSFGGFTEALLAALREGDGTVADTARRVEEQAPGQPVFFTGAEAPTSFIPQLASRQRPRLVAQVSHTLPVHAVAWHPIRPWLASGDEAGILQILDIETREVRTRTVSGEAGVVDLVFSESGRSVLVANEDGTVRAWDPVGVERQWERRVGGRPTALALQGARLAVGTDRGRVVMLNAVTGRVEGRWTVGVAAGSPLPVYVSAVPVTALAWSPDGQALISGTADGEVVAWMGTERGRLLTTHRRTLRGFGQAVQRLHPGRDANTVVASFDDGSRELFDIDAATSLGEVPARPWASALAIAKAPDAPRVATGHEDGTLRLWASDTGEQIAAIAGEAAAIRDLKWFPEHGWLGVADDAGASLWDLATGRLLHRLPLPEPDKMVAIDVARSETGLSVAAGGASGWVREWDALTAEPVAAWPLGRPVVDVAYADGALLAVTPGFLDVRGRDRVRHRLIPPRRVGPLGGVQSCGPPGSVTLQFGRDVAAYHLLTRAMARPRYGAGAICLPGGGRMAYTPSSETVSIYDVLTNERVARMSSVPVVQWAHTEYLDYAQGVAHPSEPWVAYLVPGSTIDVWNYETQQRVLRVEALGLTSMTFGPGRGLITGSADGSIRVVDIDTGAVVATMVSVGDEWIVWAPDGLFDGSPEGQETLFRWRIAGTLHPARKLHRGFYERGLLAAVAQGERPRARRDIKALKPPPRVQIVSPRDGEVVTQSTITVDVVIEDQGGGVAEPRLYLDGHRVSRMGERGLQRGTASADRRVRFHVELAGAYNHLRATALNEDRTWEALGDEIHVQWTAPPQEPPTLHVVTVGIEAYRDPELQLAYARDDAEAIGGLFAPGLFGDVQLHGLFDADATRASIRATLAKVASQASPRDALVVYLAGHGVVEGEVFYFVPWEGDLSTPDTTAQTSVSQVELAEAFAAIPASKQLVILDACHAGAASDAIAAIGRRASPARVRAQLRLAQSAGLFLIAASTASQIAQEVPELGHGILTYSIMRALGADQAPAAQLDEEGHVTVTALIHHVASEVPRLTRAYHGQPQDVVQASDGQDFPLVAP